MHLHAEEVNRDCKLTNDLFRSYKGLKDQLDKDMKKNSKSVKIILKHSKEGGE